MKQTFTLLFLLLFSFSLLISCDKAPTPEQNGELPDIREPTLSNGTEIDQREKPEELDIEFDPRSLFLPVENPDDIAENLMHESVLGNTYIKFNEHLWNPENLYTDDQLTLQLPDDIEVEATVLRVQQPLSSITSVTAQFTDTPEGTLTLNYESGRTIGDIKLQGEGRNFQIRYDSNAELHYLMEVNPSKLDTLPGAEPLDVEGTR